MKNEKRIALLIRSMLIGLILGLTLHFGLTPTLPAAAQMAEVTASTPSSSGSAAERSVCLHHRSLRILPHCRGRLLWLALETVVERHLAWDAGRWAAPVYLELDDAGQWQRLSLLCLHLSRRGR